MNKNKLITIKRIVEILVALVTSLLTTLTTTSCVNPLIF